MVRDLTFRSDGVVATGTILDTIVAHKREEVETRKQRHPLAAVQAAATQAAPPRDFARALSAPGVSLIAEIKRASPSKGILNADLNPPSLAHMYAGEGATAISVLTDSRFFRGTLADLQHVGDAVTTPVLRKDFILDPYQVYETRAHGADGLLLIMAMLTGAACRELLALTEGLGMAALVEVHNQNELDRALAAGASVVGINNRNLHTFEVNLATTLILHPQIPPDIVVVAESGIQTAEHVAMLVEAGVDAMLVGTALVTTRDPGRAVRHLVAAGAADWSRASTEGPQP